MPTVTRIWKETRDRRGNWRPVLGSLKEFKCSIGDADEQAESFSSPHANVKRRDGWARTTHEAHMSSLAEKTSPRPFVKQEPVSAIDRKMRGKKW